MMNNKKVIIKSTILKANELNTNGDMFIKEALESVVDQFVGMPVTIDFNHNNIIGKVISAKVANNDIQASIQITDKKIMRKLQSGKDN